MVRPRLDRTRPIVATTRSPSSGVVDHFDSNAMETFVTPCLHRSVSAVFLECMLEAVRKLTVSDTNELLV